MAAWRCKIDPWSFPDPEPVRRRRRRRRQPSCSPAAASGARRRCTAQLDGVLAVRPGYAGGDAATANYDDVCTGTTGHAEAIEIRFDPARIALGQILKIFFSIAHDPTQVEPPGRRRGHAVPLGDLLRQRGAAPHRRRPTSGRSTARGCSTRRSPRRSSRSSASSRPSSTTTTTPRATRGSPTSARCRRPRWRSCARSMPTC